MALQFYGKPENDPGEWIPFGLDDPFQLRVRRIPGDIAEQIDKRHRGKETFEIRDGVRRPVQDLDGIVKSLLDKAMWAWTDARGLEIEIADEEGAAQWSKLLTRDIKVGETIDLSGASLTTEVKRIIIEKMRPYARVMRPNDQGGETEVREEIGRYIALEAAKLQRDFATRREELRGNSSAG